MKVKCLMLVAVLLLSQVIIEIHNDSVSVTAAQDVEVNVPPVVEILPDVSRGMAPLIVHFDGDLYDEDGEVLSLEWDFEGDGVFEFSKSVKEMERPQRLQALRLGLQREHIYSNPGIYHAVARVTDDKGESTISSVTIQVHSDRPYLDITPCDTGFDYMAQAGYEAFFKSGITDSESVRFQMGNSWISYQWENQLFGEIGKVKGVPEGNEIWFRNVFSNCDIRYTVHNDLLLEELIVRQFIPVTVIEQSFTIHGVKYKMEDDGSIGFYNGEDLVFSIPRPVMYEFSNPKNKSYGLHYEIIERDNDYLLRKIIDDLHWLQNAQYPVVIDSSTQGEIADPWEQQGLTPYGQYFKNLNEYVDPLTGHLTIRHTDYSLSGRGLDLSVTRVYSTVVAYKEEEDGSGEFVPVATYIEAPTDLGYGWRLDFPWMEVENNNLGEYMHLPNGGQVQINFQNGVWNCPSHEFIVYDNPDDTYTKYRKNGIKEEYDSMGRLTSITDLNGNTITFTYSLYGISSITDTVGRVLTFSYSGGKLMSISDSVKTISYGYSGDKLISVTDPIGRVTVYEYLSGSSFIITGVTYPTGGFSSYQYATVVPEFVRIAPYKSSESEDGQTKYYIYKVDSADTIEWTSPQDIASVLGGGRPCVFQRDDGSLVMYYRDTYIWTEENCYWEGCPQDCQYVCETITHTEYWIKRSVSFDQHHWSTPQNVLQVKSTTGNPVVIEKQNGTYIMFYKDRYVWTEEHCEFDRRLKEWVCETITHIELNLTETKTLFPTREYVVFSGTFDENGQTAFNFDLTGLTVTNGILVISSIAVPTQETLHETHSEAGNGWLNSGNWDEENFMADYMRCVTGNPPDCWNGETEIGPFKHYPGTPNYTGYTTWIDGNTQYVQTNYLAVVNEYPEQTEYKLNSGSWTIITDSLGSGTTSITISSSEFVQGVDTLYFQETNTYQTKFDWTLYIDQESTPEEYTTSLTYDTYGNTTSVTDALGNTTLLEYDSYHLYLESITNALNHTLSASYDFNTGWLTSITDPKGNTSSFQYDTQGRVTKKINPDLSELEAAYNDQNNTVTIYDELDHYIVRYYDGLGRQIKIEWYLSPNVYLAETYSYNYLNKVETRTDPGGHIYTYEYDSKGRPAMYVNPDFTSREISYDDFSNTTSVLDENDHKEEYHYDWVGNLLWVKEYTDPVNCYLTQYTYDDLGNMTSLTDANGNTTFYRHDSPFGVSQVIYPDSTTEAFSYDAVGNFLQRTDASGTTTFTYDAVYQLIEVAFPDLTSFTFEYDANGNCTLMTDTEGGNSYIYDIRDRRISETRMIDAQSYTVNYLFDTASRLISVTYPDQSVITYEHDALNRLITIPGYAEFIYDADSLLASMTYGNGVVTSYQYDNCHRPSTVHAEKDDTDLLMVGYQYDPVGNVTHLQYNRRSPDQQWKQSTETFAYDWLDRLISAQGEYGLLTYEYDGVGNRVSLNDLTYTYNNMNELLSISNGTQFIYDENGNTQTKSTGTDTWSYTYDKRNQLLQVEKNQELIGQYAYDGEGRRIKKTEWVESLQDYQTVIYIYSGYDVIYEENVDTGQKAIYINGPRGKVAKETNGLTNYYHTDHLGSTRLVSNELGNVVTEAIYTPFGESMVNGEENYLFTGKEKDSNGLYYYGARYYDPSLGRFTTRDTYLGETLDPQSLNRYTYCKNNPLKYVDPWGNFGVLEGLTSLGGYLSGSGAGFLACLVPLLPWIILAAAIIAVVVVAVVVYEKYQEGKGIEVAQVRNIDISGDSSLSKFGHKAVVNVNPDKCKTDRIVIHREDEQKFGHYTFYKKADGNWYYHPPGHPETEVLCSEDEAAALEALARFAEDRYSQNHDGCPVSPPSPGGSGSSGNDDETQLPEGVI